MKKYPKISVLIGTYNRSVKLARCLNAIISQNYPLIEVIVVDDCSSDDTQQVLEEFESKPNSIIRSIKNKSNKGIAYNSNLAFTYCNGDYIALIGDDDYWIDKDKLKKQINGMLRNYAHISGTWWIEKGENIEVEKRPELTGNYKKRVLLRGGLICGSTPLISRKAWELVKGFDESMKRGTDSDLFRRIILKTQKAPFILKSITTIVDLTGSDRMTSQNSIKYIKPHLHSNNKLIIKFFFSLLFRYPDVLIYRITRSVKLMVRIILSFFLK